MTFTGTIRFDDFNKKVFLIIDEGAQGLVEHLLVATGALGPGTPEVKAFEILKQKQTTIIGDKDAASNPFTIDIQDIL